MKEEASGSAKETLETKEKSRHRTTTELKELGASFRPARPVSAACGTVLLKLLNDDPLPLQAAHYLGFTCLRNLNKDLRRFGSLSGQERRADE